MAEEWSELLGLRMLGVYLIGSLAHGGFTGRYSDIDMAVIAADGVRPDELDAMRALATAIAPELAPKLSIFWADRGFTMGRLPPLDRADYVDHAVPLIERERVRPARPSRAEIRALPARPALRRLDERGAALRRRERAPARRAQALCALPALSRAASL